MTNFNMVREFMSAFGQEIKPSPELPKKSVQALRVRLIAEELKELREALKDKDIVEVADALADILYVTYGAGLAFGIDLDKCFAEVQRSNMTKLGEDGKPLYREDGKIKKGPNYEEPNLRNVLFPEENA